MSLSNVTANGTIPTDVALQTDLRALPPPCWILQQFWHFKKLVTGDLDGDWVCGRRKSHEEVLFEGKASAVRRSA